MNPKVQEALSATFISSGTCSVRRSAGSRARRRSTGRGDPGGGQGTAGRPVGRGGPQAPRPARGSTVDELRTLIRAFSIYFDLINLAEQRARVRALRLKAVELGNTPMAESPEAALRQLRERGIDASQIDRTSSAH